MKPCGKPTLGNARIGTIMATAATRALTDVLTPDRLLALRELASKYGVHDLRVFGSYVRGEATPESDLDLLVDIDYGQGVAMRFVHFCQEIEKLFGMKVDVLTEDGLDEGLHAGILREARPLV
jgi:predicted nucleotidyltransferase